LKSRRHVLAVAASLAFASCADLDCFLFKGEPLDAYLLDAYPGDQQIASYLREAGPLPEGHATEVSLPSGGETIYGVLLKPPEKTLGPTDRLIVFFHGTSKHIDYYWPRTRLLYATGFPVLVVDYRGYGKSTGSPSVEGLFEDGEATLSFVARELGDPRLIVYSNSLGSVVACELAARHGGPESPIERVVFETPLSSIEAFVQDAMVMNAPASYLGEAQADNVARVEQIRVPLLWIHGTDDETLPIDHHGWPVWRAYRESNPGLGTSVVVEGGGHENLPEVVGFQPFLDLVGRFARGELPPSAQ